MEPEEKKQKPEEEKTPQINMKRVEALMQAIIQRKITVPRFRFNLTEQDALDLLASHYGSIVATRHGTPVFDVNTVYKHRRILGDNTFIIDKGDVYCVWQNEYTGDGRVEIALDFFERQPDGSYLRDCEDFAEVAYSVEETESLLHQAGLKLSAVYDDMTRAAPRSDSERIVFVARKIISDM